MSTGGNGEGRMLAADLLVNAYAMSRSMLWRRLGDPRRNLDDECGYPQGDPTLEEYVAMYDREPIAARVVDILPEESWRSAPAVFEDEDASTVTEFEEAWDLLGQDLRGSRYRGDEGHPVWEVLARADKLSGIGSYGVILLGLDDGKKLSDPVDGIDLKTGKLSVHGDGKQRKVLYMRPLDESQATIVAEEKDPASPRCGFPTKYSVQLGESPLQSALQGGYSAGAEVQEVHWTRVIHLADNLRSGEVRGVPRQRPVWRRLLDLQKLYGGSAEMYWHGAFPGMHLGTQPELGPDVRVDKEAVKDEMEKYMNSLQRYITTTGMTATMLSPTVVDPTPYVNIHVDAICIKLAVPRQVFIGSEPGKLGGDVGFLGAWIQRLRDRQCNYLIPRAIVPTVDRLILVRALPEPEEYRVEWPDLAALGEQEKAQVAVVKTDALAKYVAGQVETLFPPMDYLTRILDFTEEEASEILEAAAEVIEEKQAEQEAAMAQQQALAETQAKAQAKVGPPQQQGGQPTGKVPPQFAKKAPALPGGVFAINVTNAGDDDCEWITMGGQAVCIKGGKIVKGPDELKKLVNKPTKGDRAGGKKAATNKPEEKRSESSTPATKSTEEKLKQPTKEEPKQPAKWGQVRGQAQVEHNASVTDDQVARSFSGESKTMAIMAARTIEAGTGTGIVAKDGGKIVGITSYKVQGKDVYVRYLASAQKGVGTQLVSELAKVASRSGKGLILEGFVGATGFYEKIGMKALGKPGRTGNIAFGWSKTEVREFAGKMASKEGSAPVIHSFCPTGEGGGVDPSCSSSDVDHAMGVLAAKSLGGSVAIKHLKEAMKTLYNKGLIPRLGMDASSAFSEARSKLPAKTAVGISEPRGDSSLKSDRQLRADAAREVPVTHSFCPTGEGGGVDPSCGKEGGDSKGVEERGHNVKIPKNSKRLTIDQATSALKQMGYKRGKGTYDFETKMTLYVVKHPNGKTSTMTSKAIADIVYRGAGKESR